MSRKYALGLMSGTSADGLTICLFDCAAKKVINFKTYPYSKKLQSKILCAANFTTPRLSELNFELGRLWAQKTALFLKKFRDIAVIGSHGQTVWHAPGAKIPNTLQIGEAAFLAQRFGVPVVYNFRPRDMAAGGSGAPFMPAFDEFLYKDGEPKMLLNIGGISNIAVAGRGIKTFGFDIGPGNALIDSAVNIYTKGRLNFDKNGMLAAQYAPDIKKARKLLKNFIGKKPPVSLDRNAFGKKFFDKPVSARDISTFTYLTALIITRSIKKFVLSKHRIKTLEISGGGAKNKTLVNFIAAELKGIKIIPGSLDPMAKEAAAFAWFAWQTLHGKPSTCAAATGAKKSVIAGSIYPA